jgi:hypothetical protein
MKQKEWMDMTKKSNARPTGMVKAVGLGLCASLAITAILIFICAKLIEGERIGEGNVGGAAMVILFLSTAVGAVTSAVLLGKQKLVAAVALAGTYFLTLLGLGAALFGGHFTGIPVTAAIILGTGALIGILSAGGKKSGAKKYRKYKIH